MELGEEISVDLEKGKTLYKTQAGDSTMATMDTELMSLSEWGAGTSSMLGQVSGVIKQELLPSLECLFIDHNCLCEADGMALADALRTTAGTSDGGGPQQLASLREIDLRWQQQPIGAAAMDAIMRARPTDRLRVSV